jgi:CHAT domain-containing protein
VDDIYTYKNFWEPIQDQLTKLKIKKVFFSPDGVYNTINVSAIRNPFTNQYLLDEVDVRRVTSTRTLLEEKKIEKNSGVGYLLGFPDYKVADGTQSASAGASGNSGSRSFRGGMLRLLRNGEGIPPLPGTKTEVEGVSTALKKQFKSVEVKLEANAIESDVKTLSSPSLLHIATHGYFLDEEEGGMLVKMPNPLLMSGLIMAGAENFIQTGHNPLQSHDDGILTAYEAMNLNLDNTDLVVLSACETGLGKVQAGEGVYGLQRAFQVAGAKSIIMSLWSVDDTATQLLMGIFYDQYLKTNDLYESFRSAQQKLKEKYPQPFYWGAFILVGRGE